MVARLCTGILLSLLVAGTYFFLPAWCFSVLLLTAGLIMLAELAAMAVKVPWFWLLLPAYPTIPVSLLIALNHSEYRILLAYLFILVPVHDTAAYAVGKYWGKHKLAPSISPGKTWEGCVGGFLALFLVCKNIALAYAVSFTCIAGDLFESWLKRQTGVKDSGTLLPGHGGMLDRCDALLATGLLFYVLRDTLLRLLA